MKIGIQGEKGSACDAAAKELISTKNINAFLTYYASAMNTLKALKENLVDAALLALESPTGVPVSETSQAIEVHGPVSILHEISAEVRHCIMVKQNAVLPIKNIASHAIPLEKHKKYLNESFPDYTAVELDDTGLAARLLAENKLSDDTAVIAMPHAAGVFGLKIIHLDLPANNNYLTRFALVTKTA